MLDLPFEVAGLDSLQMFEIEIIVDDLGVLLDEEVLITAIDIDFIYDAYVDAVVDQHLPARNQLESDDLRGSA